MQIDQKIKDAAHALEEKTIARRRDFHRYPETGWTEFRTASIVIETLAALGYEVQCGAQVIDEASMMGVPPAEVLDKHRARSIAQGADPALVERMRGGKTGVVATMRFGGDGPTVALRFDMDCNDVAEAVEEKHRPYKEGFSSVNEGCMHACGHDGHTSIGLAVAQIIAALKGELRGTIKFIFQPAEEGVRGAKAMTAKGVVDDVDYLIGAHLMAPKVGCFSCDVRGFLATSKFDAHFTGVPAHTGAAPQIGKNALLAAATAAIHLHALPRHSDGISRVNVGVLHAGTGRNVIAAHGMIQVETRGATSKINQFLYENAQQVIEHAAAMYGVRTTVTDMGSAAGASNSPALSERIGKVAKRLQIFAAEQKVADIGGSEDCAYFMERVQKRGGQAAYLIIGASLTAVNHNSYFDFDEKALTLSTQLLAAAACDLLLECRHSD